MRLCPYYQELLTSGCAVMLTCYPVSRMGVSIMIVICLSCGINCHYRKVIASASFNGLQLRVDDL